MRPGPRPGLRGPRGPAGEGENQSCDVPIRREPRAKPPNGARFWGFRKGTGLLVSMVQLAVESTGAANLITEGSLIQRTVGRVWATALPPFVPVPSSLRLVKARPRPGRRRQRGGRGGLPPAHSLSSSVLVESGWWLSSCLVVRPSASAQGAATQALQRRHSGALCRAKSIHGGSWCRYVYVASCCSMAGWYGA